MRKFFFAAGVAAAFGIVAACSLGLDESLIEEGDAGGGNTGIQDSMPDGDSTAPDGGGGLERKSCKNDGDCVLNNPVLTGRCDLGLGTCAYDVCGAQDAAACTARKYNSDAGACDETDAGLVQHSYKAATFTVPGNIGCGAVPNSGVFAPGAVNRCFAAVYPFVFVGTTKFTSDGPHGVFAFSAANTFAAGDAGATQPPGVPVKGLSFAPDQIVASGSRVFFIGSVTTSNIIPIAWLDVPADPFAKELVATTVFANWNTPPADGGTTTYPSSDGGALLVSPLVAASSFSVVTLNDPLALKSSSVSSDVSINAVTTSGTRLVMGNVASGNLVAAPTFVIVNLANDGALASQPLASLKGTSTPQALATSPGGAVFWSATILVSATAAKAVGGLFLVDDANAAKLNDVPAVNIETYLQPATGVLLAANKDIMVGPVAMLDNDTAMVTAGAPPVVTNALTQTSVQFVKRNPPDLTPGLVLKNDDKTVRRDALLVTVDKVGVAASHGVGYVLIADTSKSNPLSVNVYDPNCD